MDELISPFIVNDEQPPEAVVAAPEGELLTPFKGPDFVPREPQFFDAVTGAGQNPEGLGGFAPEKISDSIVIAGKSTQAFRVLTSAGNGIKELWFSRHKVWTF